MVPDVARLSSGCQSKWSESRILELCPFSKFASQVIANLKTIIVEGGRLEPVARQRQKVLAGEPALEALRAGLTSLGPVRLRSGQVSLSVNSLRRDPLQCKGLTVWGRCNVKIVVLFPSAHSTWFDIAHHRTLRAGFVIDYLILTIDYLGGDCHGLRPGNDRSRIGRARPCDEGAPQGRVAG